jgi:hypothetical protein
VTTGADPGGLGRSWAESQPVRQAKIRSADPTLHEAAGRRGQRALDVPSTCPRLRSTTVSRSHRWRPFLCRIPLGRARDTRHQVGSQADSAHSFPATRYPLHVSRARTTPFLEGERCVDMNASLPLRRYLPNTDAPTNPPLHHTGHAAQASVESSAVRSSIDLGTHSVLFDRCFVSWNADLA